MYTIYDLHASPHDVKNKFSYDKHYLVVNPNDCNRYAYADDIYSALCYAETSYTLAMSSPYTELLNSLTVHSTIESSNAFKDQYPELCI